MLGVSGDDFLERETSKDEAAAARSLSILHFGIFYAFLECMLRSRDFQTGSPD